MTRIGFILVAAGMLMNCDDFNPPMSFELYEETKHLRLVLGVAGLVIMGIGFLLIVFSANQSED